MRTKFNNRKREHYSDWIQSIIFGDSMTIRSFFFIDQTHGIVLVNAMEWHPTNIATQLL